MRVAFHSFQMGQRGTEICLHKYAKYNRELLGNESVIISSIAHPTHCLDRFKDFDVILYPEYWVDDNQNDAIRNKLELICDQNKIDVLYAIKSGDNDGMMPTNVKTATHCVFRMHQPHGTVYAGVCKYMSNKFGGVHPYVHHILEKDSPDVYEGLREELGIPNDALVLGRHGGFETFNLDFTYGSISRALESRKDLWFVFLNTHQFIQHERVIYLPWTMDEIYKSKFVNTCDAMMHGRLDGEVFSLSIAEFSFRNKSVITWSPDEVPWHYDTGHLYILKDKAIYYRDENELYTILTNLDRNKLQDYRWDEYCYEYGKERVMNEFNEVFLK
jgi:hypothetical protein